MSADERDARRHILLGALSDPTGDEAVENAERRVATGYRIRAKQPRDPGEAPIEFIRDDDLDIRLKTPAELAEVDEQRRLLDEKERRIEARLAQDREDREAPNRWLERMGVLSYYVYRMYAADGSLLYIGSTGNLVARMRQHYASQPWIGDVAQIIISDPIETREAAYLVEDVAIRDERPLHNKNGRRRR